MYLLAILGLLCYRVFPHPYNLTPLLSSALFSGVFIHGRMNKMIIPIASMLITDSILGFYPSMIFTYLAVLVIIGLGCLLSKKKTFSNVLLGTFCSSFVFFLVSNFGVWLMGTMYAHTLQGLLVCYSAGLPFFQNTMQSAFFFSALFYALYKGAIFVGALSFAQGSH